MNDFFVYLPSNVNSIYFQNTSANFKTKLARYCSLNGIYEVGLAEISYTYSFLNISEDEIIQILYLDSEYTEFRKYVKLKKGYYTIEDLISSLNNIIQINENYVTLPKFELYDEKNYKKIKLVYGKTKFAPIFLRISYNLARILGISKSEMDEISNHIITMVYYDYEYTRKNKDLNEYDFEIPEEIKAENLYDISGGFHTIFVYCDIIKANFVGDSKTQLLRFVEIPYNFGYGDQVHLIFDKIQYFPLITNEFESIEIDIKDDTGKNIPFNFAKNIIVLHFRKRNNNRDDADLNKQIINSNDQSIFKLLQ